VEECHERADRRHHRGRGRDTATAVVGSNAKLHRRGLPQPHPAALTDVNVTGIHDAYPGGTTGRQLPHPERQPAWASASRSINDSGTLAFSMQDGSNLRFPRRTRRCSVTPDLDIDGVTRHGGGRAQIINRRRMVFEALDSHRHDRQQRHHRQSAMPGRRRLFRRESWAFDKPRTLHVTGNHHHRHRRRDHGRQGGGHLHRRRGPAARSVATPWTTWTSGSVSTTTSRPAILGTRQTTVTPSRSDRPLSASAVDFEPNTAIVARVLGRGHRQQPISSSVRRGRRQPCLGLGGDDLIVGRRGAPTRLSGGAGQQRLHHRQPGRSTR